MGDRSRRRRPITFLWAAVVLAAAALLGSLLVRRRRREKARQRAASLGEPEHQQPQPEAVLELQGLSEEEVAARRLEVQGSAPGSGAAQQSGGAIQFKLPYSNREIWRANTLTIFNLSMVGLAFVQILLGKPLDAILTTGVMLLGIGLNVGQQVWARGRVQKLGQAARPQATVVRAGRVRSIDPSEIVRGDVLVVGPGDQVLADGQVLGEGQLILDESMLTGDPRQHTKQVGEAVYAGSFCLAGHGAYEAQKIGGERLIVALTGEFQAVEEELTPLERTISRLLRALLLVVTVLSLILLADFSNVLFPELSLDTFASAASVIFGIAPSSLFLMILVNYAMGTADLAKIGALVHRSRSVESLAQATVICSAQEGILTGVDLAIDPVKVPTDGDPHWPHFSKSRIRQILGAFARSTSVRKAALRAMETAFPGEKRSVREDAPFLSLFGWTAVAFDDDDLRGVFVLGDPDVLGPYLVDEEVSPADSAEVQSLPAAWRNRLEDAWRILARPAESAAENDGIDESDRQPAATAGDTQGTRNLDELSKPKVEESPGGFVQRLLSQVNLALGRQEGELDSQPASKPIEEAVYLVAYFPEIVPLHTDEGMPRLPEGLLPLCRLRYSEQVRPEALETIQALAQAGVDIKVFASDAPERTMAFLEQAGLAKDRNTPLASVSGSELTTMDPEAFARAARENSLFDQVTPELEGRIVAALRDQGEVVAVVGDGVNDLPAMQQANLSITRQSSSPAALSVADIVLLEDSSQALLALLEKGQRIVNGLLDILKLYLNQICYLILLILAIWGMGLGFPYQSKQNSIITIVSVILPSLGLTLWAPPGVLPATRLGWLLARFVVPAAATMSAAAVIVYRIFYARTIGTAYAQLATTYMMLFSGLLLVVLLRPPVRGLTLAGTGRDERSGDWRPAALVVVLLILVLIVASIPLADQLFGLKPLRQLTHYAIVVIAVLAWAFAASLLWRVAPLKRFWPG